MLKGGIFIDSENLSRNGGWGLRIEALRELVERQGITVLRASAYMAVDEKREAADWEYRDKVRGYRERIRRCGFHIVEKRVKRFTNEDGTETLKANADLDMAIDALLQAQNLDHILLATGDGDFVRLVRALRNQGKRVDALGFRNVSGELKREVDHYFEGALLPGLLPAPASATDGSRRERGQLYNVNAEKGYGFLATRTGPGMDDWEEGIFCHISNVTEDGEPVENQRLNELGHRNAILEFTRVETDKGRGYQAMDVSLFHDNS